jgi:hypothetical protein
MAETTTARESDLYAPLRDYLVAQGYAVQGEVKRCDVVARKDDDLIVIELKQRFSTQLLVQAVDRQKITDSVYVALPGPYEGGRRSRWRGIEPLLRRLELGLIAVTLGDPPHVQVVFHPLPYRRRKQSRRKRAVLQEVAARTGDYNQGGSVRRAVVTAYRENAIHIACCLRRFGPLTPKELRALGTCSKTTRIVASNFYGWFRRVDRGVYELTPQGHRELDVYPELGARYGRLLDEKLAGTE